MAATKEKKVEETNLVYPGGNPLFTDPIPAPAHQRPENLDPKTNGPFLDDIREIQETAYRERRNVKKPNKATTKRIMKNEPGVTETEAEARQTSVMRDDATVAEKITQAIEKIAPAKMRPYRAEETPENHSEDSAIRDPRLDGKHRDSGSAGKVKDNRYRPTEKIGVNDKGELEERPIKSATQRPKRKTRPVAKVASRKATKKDKKEVARRNPPSKEAEGTTKKIAKKK